MLDQTKKNFLIKYFFILAVIFSTILFIIVIHTVNLAYKDRGIEIENMLKSYIKHIKRIAIENSLGFLNYNQTVDSSFIVSIFSKEGPIFFKSSNLSTKDISIILDNIKKKRNSIILKETVYLLTPFVFKNKLYYSLINLNNVITSFARISTFEGQIVANLYEKSIILFSNLEENKLRFVKDVFLEDFDLKLKVFLNSDLYFKSIPATIGWLIILMIPAFFISFYLNSKYEEQIKKRILYLLKQIESFVSKNKLESKDIEVFRPSIKDIFERVKNTYATKKIENIENEIDTELISKDIINKFSSNIIKNLQNIIFFVELNKNIEDEYQKKLKKIVNEIISDIEKINELSEVYEEKPQIKLSFANIKNLLSDIYFKYFSEAESKGIKINVSINVENDYILIDEKKFRRIVEELFNNAIKFTQKGWIDFQYNQTPKEMSINIANTGKVIKNSYLENPYIGSGTGLRIVEKFVELFKGTFEYTEIPSGVKVDIRIPINFENILDLIDLNNIKAKYMEISEKMGIEKGISSKIFDRSIKEIKDYFQFLLEGGAFEPAFLESKIKNLEEMNLNQIAEILKYVNYQLNIGNSAIILSLLEKLKTFI